MPRAAKAKPEVDKEVQGGVPMFEEQENEEVVETEVEDREEDEAEGLLFPDGPTLDMVEEWRSRYTNIYLTEFDDGEVFIWRSLIRKEYKEVMKVQNADSFYKEERICERVLLWPQGYNFMAMSSGKAGVPTLISELVLEKSGFQAKTGAMPL